LSALENKTLKIVNICFAYIKSECARKTNAHGKISFWKLHRSKKMKLALLLDRGNTVAWGKVNLGLLLG